jgi:hypothetical protein|tara:strand:- start:300 stop:440 length:141 start_codon:yes stop_codon:yes gene_type:complete
MITGLIGILILALVLLIIGTHIDLNSGAGIAGTPTTVTFISGIDLL